MNHIVIPHISEGVSLTTGVASVLAEDDTPRHIETLVAVGRGAVVQRTIFNPYRVITTPVTETLGLTDLPADDPKLIDCTGYSELMVHMYVTYTPPLPDPFPGLLARCIAYLQKDDGTYAPVAVLSPDVFGLVAQQLQGVPPMELLVGSTNWTAVPPTQSIRVGLFDKVGIFLSEVTATNLTQVALCYAMA